MPIVELRFPTGRLHATPWGRHVNEGAVEWPPSPWRIVRALIATWYMKARRADEITESTVRALVDALSQKPEFHLPRPAASHTRHYMPGKGGDKPKVFATFIQMDEKDSVLVAWDMTLAKDQVVALKPLDDRWVIWGVLKVLSRRVWWRAFRRLSR